MRRRAAAVGAGGSAWKLRATAAGALPPARSAPRVTGPDRPVARGAEALREPLRERTLDLRELDARGFRGWLARRLERWSRDPVFRARARVRDLRRAHPELVELEAEVRRAEAADRASPAHARLEALRREIGDAEKAVAGLSSALRAAGETRRDALREKLEAFRARREALAVERENLTRASPERQTLLRLRERLARLGAECGVERAREELERLQREQGRRSGRSGGEFEALAEELTRAHLLPVLAGRGAARVEVLRGVTLGAAATELDQVVLRPAARGGPAEVLAVVEVKRNPNDLGHGFLRRQENLAWLRGDRDRYDPEALRTRTFPEGHFDHAVVLGRSGERHTVTPESFAGLARDPATGHVLHGLCLITRSGWLWGASAAALSRIAHRVSGDLRWDPDDEAYLAELLEWCRPLAAEVEAPDVVRMYAGSEALAERLLLVGA